MQSDAALKFTSKHTQRKTEAVNADICWPLNKMRSRPCFAVAICFGLRVQVLQKLSEQGNRFEFRTFDFGVILLQTRLVGLWRI